MILVRYTSIGIWVLLSLDRAGHKDNKHLTFECDNTDDISSYIVCQRSHKINLIVSISLRMMYIYIYILNYGICFLYK